ncbi:protein DpdD [Kineococcus radiotolerans]|uniref:Uncharacterized protein n=1 Tax=Kineococcus radiotolerans (strain ATCC BAA-149 / DSM 14245 / SRS30216) TaxID=266940 RepID=A6WGA8_KINRD|nr:protein DpdD [Kineococcus radiotolerans]ABS05847.1 hypothetical protein Krad_4385 [Kineococcus radiotolerans SRS30216 = ATCC BAA-149]
MDTAQFMTTWFGPGNDFTLPSSWETDPRYTRMRPFLLDLDAIPNQPLFLPRLQAAGRLMYATAFNAAQARQLQEALTAFVGPSYSNFDPVPTRLNAHDPLESALQRLGTHTTWRLTVPTAAWEAAWQAAALLRATWLRRPWREADTPTPVGRLLRDFRLSLAAGDEALSARYLQRLIDSGSLDTANITYLKIRRLNALGARERTLDLPEFDDVLRMRLPRGVRQVLLAAVHERYLGDAEAHQDTAWARQALQRHPHLSALQSGGDVTGPREALSTLLVLNRLYPNQAQAPNEELWRDDPWLRALAEDIPPAATSPAPATAPAVEPDVPALLNAARYAEAWDKIQVLPRGPERDRLAVMCALNLDDAQCSLGLAAEFTQQGEDYLTSIAVPGWLQESWQRHLRQVAGLNGQPQAWADLLRLAAAGSMTAGMLTALEEVIDGWPSPGADDDTIAAILEANSLSGPGLTQTLDVIPLLLQSVEAGEAPRTSGGVLQLLIFSEEYTAATLSALAVALQRFLAASPEGATYGDTLGMLSETSARWVQVRTADTVLDLIDVILAGPNIAPSARVATCGELLTRLRSFAVRLSPAQLVLASALSDEVDCALSWPLPQADVANVADASAQITATVLLYSLQEHVLQRAEQALSFLFPRVTVHTSSHLAGTSQLRDQARACDVLVVATTRASHAATDFLQRHKTGSIVYPSGAGSGSMLRAATEALLRLSEE